VCLGSYQINQAICRRRYPPTNLATRPAANNSSVEPINRIFKKTLTVVLLRGFGLDVLPAIDSGIARTVRSFAPLREEPARRRPRW
jgi:hypothetical protein